MNSRMDKYDVETPELKKRTERNRDLYYSEGIGNYDKFDINSNVEVLKNNAKNIDIDQIKEMLDKKYRDNMPKRKSIDIPKFEEPKVELDEDTKEYDLNSLLSKAKEEKQVDYDSFRLNTTSDSKELINKINEKYVEKKDNDDEKELKELIDTITALEMKNQKNDAELLDLADESNDNEQTHSGIIPKTEEFYTGQVAVTEEDFDDFKEMQDDIKSNSIFVKILVFIFVLLVIAALVFVANKIFNLGLF